MTVELEARLLRSTLTHLSGRCRAFLLELEAIEGELAQMDSQWAVRLVEALSAVKQPGALGTLRYVERLAAEALRSDEQMSSARP